MPKRHRSTAEFTDPRGCPACNRILDGAKALSVHISRSNSCREELCGQGRGTQATEEVDDSTSPDEGWQSPRLNGHCEPTIVQHINDGVTARDGYDDLFLSVNSKFTPTVDGTDPSYNADARARWGTDQGGQEEIEDRSAGDTTLAAGRPPTVSIDYTRYLFQDGSQTYGREPNLYEKLFSEERDQMNPFFPFANQADWEIGRWLVSSGCSQAKINEFLSTSYASLQPPSFRSANELMSIIDQLPGGPTWYHEDVTIPEALGQAQTLFYRNPLECIRYLFGNPLYRGHMHYDAVKLFAMDNPNVRIYNEMNTGTDWEAMQVSFDHPCNNLKRIEKLQETLAPGETFVPVILGSDKTHLTNFSGDKSVHPLYLSIGNISKDIRAKTSYRAFLLLAYIPQGAFAGDWGTKAKNSTMKNVLQKILFHACCSIIFRPLWMSAAKGVTLIDPDGFNRRCVCHLAAWIADHPEVQMLTCISSGCPYCETPHRDLQLGVSKRRRNPADVLEQLQQLKRSNPQLPMFIKACRAVGLVPIPHPFWADMPSSAIDISRMLVCDILHGLHKFFSDHTAQYVTNMVGVRELDARLKALPKSPGFRHFSKGISGISQWSGREHRDLQRYLLAAVNGHHSMVPRAIRALRSQLDFNYLARYRTHDDMTLKYLVTAGSAYQKEKWIYCENGSRRGKSGPMDHFNVAKSHTTCHVAEMIRRKGTMDNYDSEITERYHVQYAKEAFEATNRKDFESQMIHFLSRGEKLLLFSLYLAYRLGEKILSTSHQQMGSRVGIEAVQENILEQPGQEMCPSPDTAYRLAQVPSIKRRLLGEVATLYDLPSLIAEIALYFKDSLQTGLPRQSRLTTHDPALPPCFDRLNIWHRFTLTMSSTDEDFGVPSKRAVRARLPEAKDPFPRFDTVLVHVEEQAENEGLRGLLVGRVRLIFQPCPTLPALGNCHSQPGNVGRWLRKHYAYIEWFTKPVLNTRLNMYTVQWHLKANGHKKASIIPLDSVLRDCALAPVWKHGIPEGVDSNNCLDVAKTFLINNYMDTLTFQTSY